MPRKYKEEKERTSKGPPFKYTEKVLDKLANELTAWSKKPTSYYLKEFLADCELTLMPSQLTELAEFSTNLAEALMRAKQRLCARLYQHSSTKAIDGNFVKMILPLVDPEYREWCKEFHKIETQTKDNKFLLLIDADRMPKKQIEVKHEEN